MMIQIDAPHFYAGGEIGGKFAPIIRYMEGWSYDKIVRYCEKKGWKIVEVTGPSGPS